MARILVDTSAIYALVDRHDANHQRAKATLQRLRDERAEPLLTNFLLGECHALLLARLGADVGRRWILGNVWRVERVVVADEDRAIAILREYRDKSFSYVDATSFAVMERLRLRHAFTFDAHFRQFGLSAL